MGSQGSSLRPNQTHRRTLLVKISHPLLAALSTLAWVQAASAVEVPPAPAVLAQLHTQLDQIRSKSEQKLAGLERPDLSSLIGLHRNQLSSALGAPNYCDPPNDDGCTQSTHWAYFFYHWEPTAREKSGMVEIAIPRQGWAIEIRFTESGAIESADWRWQE